MVKDKSGEITWELVRTIIFVVVLVIMVMVVVVLFTGKGGALLDSVKNILRFGR